jgi:hypothetical protein
MRANPKWQVKVYNTIFDIFVGAAVFSSFVIHQPHFKLERPGTMRPLAETGKSNKPLN